MLNTDDNRDEVLMSRKIIRLRKKSIKKISVIIVIKMLEKPMHFDAKEAR